MKMPNNYVCMAVNETEYDGGSFNWRLWGGLALAVIFAGTMLLGVGVATAEEVTAMQAIIGTGV